MKKLFTLVALLAMCMGAKAQQTQWEQVYSIDYSTYQGFPFYVMGYVPEFDNGCMTDFGALFKYTNKEEEDKKEEGAETSDVIVKTQGGVEYYKVPVEGSWHQYFIADGITTEIDGAYKVIAKVKASEAVTININMGWGWGEGQAKSASVSIPAGDEFQEVEWEYEGIGGSSCNLVAQPGGATATIEWESLVVYHKLKANQRPKEWLEAIENGDAEKSWAEMGLGDVKFDDMENNFKICAWGKEKGVNMNEKDGWDPFPATIEEENGNHYFVVHGKKADSAEGSAWDNQFWIQSPKAWKSGTTVKIKFRYKASKTVEVETQTHNQTPSDYLIWHGIGNVTFTEDWQNFEKDVTFADDMANGWSFAFNLNAKDTDPIDFYFDDLSWQYLKLDEGYFVSGINTATTTSYDNLDNAVQFEYDEKEEVWTATFGEEGNADSYVDQIMISTTRGDDQAFKGATLKPAGKITNDADDWLEFTASTNAKLDLPGLGVWKVYIDEAYGAMAFEMLEGEEFEQPDPVDIVTNKTEIVVKAVERDDLSDTFDQSTQERTGREEEGGAGETWDNQFWFKANRTLAKGEVTHLKFSYKANKEAKTSTQCHGNPGAYMHWGAIGDVNFTEDWQEFDADFTVPNEADGMQTIAFNMAEIKEACDYEIKDVQWYLVDPSLDEGLTYENLINETGTENFWVKISAGTDPYQYTDGEQGISTVVANSNATKLIYNMAGQRVNKAFKGIVVKNGNKYVVK